ncbi:MAG: HAMP domain-containing protein [Lachnospiraceae bacterium]|jgi:signal transduction histidine kinase|nr:HAMP domain-containing protein [Lachnospiraceae bacterium]
MKKKFKHSLRFKLTMLLMVLMALTIFGSVAITWLSIRHFFVGRLKQRMIGIYNDVNVVFSTERTDKQQTTDLLNNIMSRGDISVFIFDVNDGTRYTNINEESKMLESMQSLASLLQGQDELGLSELLIDGNKGRYQFTKNYDSSMNGEFYDLTGVLDDGSLIALRSSGARLDDNVKITLALYSYVGVFSIIIGCISMFVASNYYVKPIHEMAVAAKKMSQLDFDTRVTTNSQDEIGELGNSINSMSKELEATISELKTANVKLAKDIEKKNQIDEMRKEFLSHVSHELKTPIALIQGYAEGLKENISDDSESRDFYCEVIMDEADRMNTMVKKLMALNELEFGTDKITLERFDIVELMKNINQSSDILLQQKNIDFDFPYQDTVCVWGDEFMIEEVYSNYLTNAIHYSPENGKVRIGIEEKEDVVRINVYNDGDNIPEEELSKIWIKFYKVDKARTREYGGSGIGLSIVAATMKLHGRDYGAYNVDGGVVFYFELEKAKQNCITEKC